MNLHITAIMSVLYLVSPAGFCDSADYDNDGIADAFEDELLQRFAPVIIRNAYTSGPEEFLAIPVTASWFVRETDLGIFGPLGTWQPILPDPTPESLLIFSLTNGQAARDMFLDFRNEDAKWGESAVEPTGWSDAIAAGKGVYGRVWRPWPTHPHMYSVQYYVLLTWNESGDCDVSNDYRHDGDILCLDFGIDASMHEPMIVHAIYHNHGRQIFLTRDAIYFEDSRPVAFIERGSNEPWPNAGAAGGDGWPRRDGVAWLSLDCGPLPQSCCERSHLGEGNVYRTWNVPNLGEAPWHDDFDKRTFYPLSSLDNSLFLIYPGAWGRRGGPPKGPAYQAEMWLRNYNGPWTSGSDPERPELERMPLRMSDGPFCITPTNTLGRFSFLPVCDVAGENTNNQCGLPSQPFVSVRTATEKVASHGVVRIKGATYLERLEVAKPMQIESSGGLVTIGL